MTLSEFFLFHRQWNDRLSHPPEKVNILRNGGEHSLCWFKAGDLHWIKKEGKHWHQEQFLSDEGHSTL